MVYVGRVILDRAGPPMDDFWSSLDFTIQDNSKPKPAVNAVDSKLPTEVGEKLALDEKSSLQDPFEDWHSYYIRHYRRLTGLPVLPHIYYVANVSCDSVVVGGCMRLSCLQVCNQPARARSCEPPYNVIEYTT
ncbi:hypothetical protein J6590_028705 [Homalodisca vitripennis]|nr:hypothetical protein J6590_028705 [Homalodisca vitripennis]